MMKQVNYASEIKLWDVKVIGKKLCKCWEYWRQLKQIQDTDNARQWKYVNE